MRISDLRGLAQLAHAHGALLSVDNSIMSPVLSNPIALGADIVIHSATKFMGGHSDVMAGVVAVKDEEIARRIGFVQNAEGSGLAPFDSWLVLRGIKTMALRVAAAQANAMELAETLRNHPLVTKVHYLMPEDTRGSGAQADAARLHFSQARGGGALLSFETGDVAVSRAIVKRASQKRGGMFKQTVSFGSVSSLIEIPAEMSHASIPEEEREGHLPADLIRISVGIEDVNDLIHGLCNALTAAQTDTGISVPFLSTAPGKVPRKVAAELPAGGGAGTGALPFGVSLPPNNIHAVGVSMPSWKDVIDYEEGCPEAHGKLESGYPRFVFLQSVQKLHAAAVRLFAAPNETAMAMPSARAAIRLQKFLIANNVDNVNLHDFYVSGGSWDVGPKQR
jgi:hypothetical protein